MVSPHVIVLPRQSLNWVTVHAEIPFSAVDTTESVELNGIAATAVFADDCGDLVAKFKWEDVMGLIPTPAPATMTLALTGTRTDGIEFTGSETVRVLE